MTGRLPLALPPCSHWTSHSWWLEVVRIYFSGCRRIYKTLQYGLTFPSQQWTFLPPGSPQLSELQKKISPCQFLFELLVQDSKCYTCLMQNARSHNPLHPPYSEHHRQHKWQILCLPVSNPGEMKMWQESLDFQLFLLEGTSRFPWPGWQPAHKLCQLCKLCWQGPSPVLPMGRNWKRLRFKFVFPAILFKLE